MGEVSVKGAEHARCPGGVRGVQGHRGPVHVPDDQTPTGAQDPVQLGQGGVGVGHVLQHLHRQGGVEGGVGDRQGGRVRQVELDIVVALRAAPGQGQGVGAGVDADQRPGGPDLLDQLSEVEAGATTDVQDALAGGGL